MIRGYASTINPIIVVAMLIGMSAHVQASEHGNMVGRHKMSCKQLVMAVLGLSAVVHGAVTIPECVKIKINNESIGLYEIEKPVCRDTLGSQSPEFVAGKVEGQLGHSGTAVASIESTDCLRSQAHKYQGMRQVIISCLDLSDVSVYDVRYFGPASDPKKLSASLQLPASVQ